MEIDGSEADRKLNATGLLCPEPLMLVRAELRKMQVGETLSVQASDPTTERDLTKLCKFMGHELLTNSHKAQIWTFRIRKGQR